MKHLFVSLLLLTSFALSATFAQDSTNNSAPTSASSNPAPTTDDKPAKEVPFSMQEMLLIISLCGLVGGYANYRRTAEQLRTTVTGSATLGTEPVTQPATPDERRRHLLTCLTLGLLSSALVPLFLNSLSSNLLFNKTDQNLLIFAGFCLLAGIASNGFIDALTQRMLNQMRETQRQVNEAARQVNESRIETATLLESSREQLENLKEKPE